RVKTLMMVDSLDMKPADRRRILDACRKAPEKRIVVTHGTDTMVETARLLGRSIKGKTVVLTGAMIPYKFGSSDGLFNLGSALSFVQALPRGFSIAMNGRVLPWDDALKDRAKGLFKRARG
ncbi:MAG: asparaginase domain-containing protein, partial [candidate division NC10 bacterium]